jgi:hypothetical protein
MSEPDPLKVCQERVAELESENEALRRSADAFGQLAERLNAQLQEERRHGERRRQLRTPPDRRKLDFPET